MSKVCVEKRPAAAYGALIPMIRRVCVLWNLPRIFLQRGAFDTRSMLFVSGGLLKLLHIVRGLET